MCTTWWPNQQFKIIFVLEMVASHEPKAHQIASLFGEADGSHLDLLHTMQ